MVELKHGGVTQAAVDAAPLCLHFLNVFAIHLSLQLRVGSGSRFGCIPVREVVAPGRITCK